jgi:predicted aspartyl protease
VLASVSAIGPHCLQRSIVKGKANGVELNALIDTGSSLSFTNQSLVKQCGIHMGPYFGRISMANSSMLSEINGHCKVDVEMEGYTCNDVEMFIMKDLCSDVLISHDILKSHSFVEIAFHGDKPQPQNL